MAYQDPAIALPKAMPTFGSGYAIGAASQAGLSLWNRCGVAFAPFLGPTTNPTAVLFGNGVRAGTVSFSGGRPAQSKHGWGWEFTSTSDQIVCGKDGDILGTTPFGTIIIGMRKTDGTARNAALMSVNLTTFDAGAFWLKNLSGTLHGNWRGGTLQVTLAAGLTQRTEHVYTYTRQEAGQTGIMIVVDGEQVATASGATNARTVQNADVIIGSAANVATTDLMVIDFAYMFVGHMDQAELNTLIADPGIMFRPIPTAVGRAPTVSIAGSISGTATVTGAIAGKASVAGTVTGTGTLTGGLLSDVATILGSITGTASTIFGLAGASSITGSITATESDVVDVRAGMLIAGPVSGTATVTGDIIGHASVAGTVTGTSTVTGNLLSDVTVLSGSVTATASATLDLSLLSSIAGSITATESGVVDVRGGVLITSAVSGSGSLGGALEDGRPMTATIVGLSTVAASLSLKSGLTGLASGAATSVLNLTALLPPPPPPDFSATERPSMGAADDSQADILRKHLNSALKGPGWDALIAAFAAGNAANLESAERAADQLSVSTASGKYLDRLAGDRGIRRPSGLGLGDEAYRQLTIKVANRKLTQQAILDVLEIFYGSEAVRAHSSTEAFEPYALNDGDTLGLLLDENQSLQVVFHTADATNLGFARAIEVAAVINRALTNAKSQAYALVLSDTQTGMGMIRIYSGSAGSSSSVRVTGGTAQSSLRFPTSLFTVAGFTPISWTVSLSPTTPRIRFAATPSSRDLSQVLIGDYVNISGTAFSAHNLSGSYVVVQVSVTGSGQYFEAENADASGLSAVLVQTGFDQVLFFRPAKHTLYSTARRVVVSDSGEDRVNLVLPVTTQTVSRTATKAAYLHVSDPASFSEVSRDGMGTVTVTTVENHGYEAGDLVLVDNFQAALIVPPAQAPLDLGGYGIIKTLRSTFTFSSTSFDYILSANEVHKLDDYPHITKVTPRVVGEILTGSGNVTFRLEIRATADGADVPFITLPTITTGPGFFSIAGPATSIPAGRYVYDWFVQSSSGSGSVNISFFILEIS